MLQNTPKCWKKAYNTLEGFKRLTRSRKTSKGSFSITKFEDEKSASLVTSINARSWNFKVKMRLGRPWPSFFVAYKVRMVCAYFQKNFFCFASLFAANQFLFG